MKAFLAIVSHEIHERRAVFAAAAVASVLPLLAPLLAGSTHNSPSDIRLVAMMIMVLGLVPLFSLLLGAGFVGRDLAEGRLGFFFSQPVSGPAIWFGKLTAVAILVWAAQLIIMLPTALLSGDPGRILSARGLVLEPVGAWTSTVVFWVGPLAVVLLAHAFGIVWRARSVWIIGDVVAFVLLVGAVRHVEAPFLQIFAAHILVVVTVWLVVMALIGLVAAGAIQVTVGRVDARRGHRALSAVLWGVLSVAVLGAGVWGWWVRSASPSDLTRVNEVSAGSGEWIAVTGHSPGRFDYYPGFIVNTIDGRWVLAHSGSRVHERGMAFSADQSRAVWTAPFSFEETKLMTVELNEDPLRPEWTGIVVRRRSHELIVSPSGRRVGLIEEGRVAVYDLETTRLVAAAQLTDGFSPVRIRFIDATTLELLGLKRVETSDDVGTSRSLWKKHRLDLATRKLDNGEEIDGTWRWWGGPIEDQFGNKLERREVDGQDRLFITESATGGILADLGEMPSSWSVVRVSSEGWIVVAREDDDGKRLEIFDQQGEATARVDFDDPGWLRIGGETGPGRLAAGLVAWADEPGEPHERTTKVVDLATGEVVETLEGMSPVLGRWGLGTSPGAWKPGSVATRLMDGTRGKLHYWNPDTGELAQIIPIPE